MSTGPAVSVIIPAFNAARTIRTTIESVLKQTTNDLELIICNDASTDATAAVIHTFQDERIHLIENKTNLGEGASRDKAIAIARGRWVAVLDADDAWQPERLEALLAATTHNEDAMIFDDLMICHDSANNLKPWRPLRGKHSFHSCGEKPVNISATDWVKSNNFLIKPLIPTSRLHASGVIHSSRRYGEDTEFFLRLVAYGITLRYVPQAHYLYRMTLGSLSDTSKRAQLMHSMLEDVLPLFSDKPATMRALQYRIDYKSFTMAIKACAFVKAARLACRQPALLAELLTRGTNELAYLLHRKLYGATGRR